MGSKFVDFIFERERLKKDLGVFFGIGRLILELKGLKNKRRVVENLTGGRFSVIHCNATDILAGMGCAGEWEGNGNIIRAKTHICPTCMAFLASSSNPGVHSSP